MILKYNKNTELEIIGIGIFGPGDVVVIDDDVLKAKKYLDTGYFDLVKEKKKRVKKSKKKGVDKLCHKDHVDI